MLKIPFLICILISSSSLAVSILFTLAIIAVYSDIDCFVDHFLSNRLNKWFKKLLWA